jgi:hypothetical protein
MNIDGYKGTLSSLLSNSGSARVPLCSLSIFESCDDECIVLVGSLQVADLVLLMVDGSFGFEMDTFEFLNMLQVQDDRITFEGELVPWRPQFHNRPMASMGIVLMIPFW